MNSSNEDDKKIWVSYDGSLASQWKSMFSPKVLKNGIAIAHVKKSELEPDIFLYHESFDDALQYVKQLATVNPNHKFQDYTIDNKEQVEKFVREIRENNLLNVVNSFQQIHTRNSKSSYSFPASNKVAEIWKNVIGSARSDIIVEQLNHKETDQRSVVLIIPGTEMRDEIVILGAHLDSTANKEPGNPKNTHPNTRSPGADDDASGLSLLTECLRIIVKTGYKPKKTIHLMGFAAEEDGMFGSREIAKEFRDQSRKISGMLQFDMIGYRLTDIDIYLVDDNTNKQQNLFLENLMDRYMSDVRHGRMKCGYACSDHSSFHAQNFPASMAFEAPSVYDLSPLYHTSRDTEVDAKFMKNYVRLALSYIAELAKTSHNE